MITLLVKVLKHDRALRALCIIQKEWAGMELIDRLGLIYHDLRTIAEKIVSTGFKSLINYIVFERS